MKAMIQNHTSSHWIIYFIEHLWTPRLYATMKSRYIPALFKQAVSLCFANRAVSKLITERSDKHVRKES